MSDNELRALLCKVGVLGLDDLRKLAPIGDIGYLNGIDFHKSYDKDGLRKFCRTTLLSWIMRAFDEQREKKGWTVNGGETCWRCTDRNALAGSQTMNIMEFIIWIRTTPVYVPIRLYL